MIEKRKNDNENHFEQEKNGFRNDCSLSLKYVF